MLEDFKAYQLAKSFYQACKSTRLPWFLREQLQRASASVVLNLAEGSGKRTHQDQRRFYSIAFESLRECRAILEMEQVVDPDLHLLADQLSAILYVLSRSIPRSPEAAPEAQTVSASVSDSASASASDPGFSPK